MTSARVAGRRVRKTMMAMRTDEKKKTSNRAHALTYFVQAGIGGPIKIGQSADVYGRVANIQSSHYEELHLLVATARVPEDEAHEKFAHLHIRGEWYHAAADLLEFIDGIRSSQSKAPPKKAERLSVSTRSVYLRLRHALEKVGCLVRKVRGEPDQFIVVDPKLKGITHEGTLMQLAQEFGVLRKWEAIEDDGYEWSEPEV